MQEHDFSYLPKVHKHNHNNITAKHIQQTWYVSELNVGHVDSLVKSMNINLKLLYECTDDGLAEAYKAKLKDIRDQLYQLEYFDLGSGTNESR